MASDSILPRHAQYGLFSIFLRCFSLLLAQDLNRILGVYITSTTPYRGRGHQIPIALIHKSLPMDIFKNK